MGKGLLLGQGQGRYRRRRSCPTAYATYLAPCSQTKLQLKLPDLPYDYGALEPVIIGEIMELHHKKHHQARRHSPSLVLGSPSCACALLPLCQLLPALRTTNLPRPSPRHPTYLICTPFNSCCCPSPVQAYVTGANSALEQYQEAQHKGDVAKIIALQASTLRTGRTYATAGWAGGSSWRLSAAVPLPPTLLC